MKKTLLILLLLAACGRDDPAANGQARGPDPAAPAAARSSPPASAKAAAGTRLTGLYESSAGPRKNQLCIVEKGGEAEFGLLVWGGNLNSCSGAGQASRSGGRLSLKMTGDETCTVQASIEDGVVTLPESLPLGCAYYCGGRASLAGARLTRTGTSETDAKKARDIAGDPLCD